MSGTYNSVTVDMSWEPALPYAVLLQDVTGHKQYRSFILGPCFGNQPVLRGTLLLRLSPEEVRGLNQYQSVNATPFNFKVQEEPSIKIYCNAHVVQLLNYEQMEILLAIRSLHNRFNAVDKLEWADKLKEGSTVYVTIPTLPTVAKGVVRYAGKLPGESGRYFGVEMLVCSYVFNYVYS